MTGVPETEAFSISMDVDVDRGTVKSLASCNCCANEDSESGDFECNICFDTSQDPVVTLCGHLYCWPCLYQWLQVHFYSYECPVCKAIIEEEKLVPIYGRGKGRSNPRPQLSCEVDIPNRPVGQRPPTAPLVQIPYFRQEEPALTGYARLRNITLSALLAIFSVPRNGMHDTVASGGSSTGIPYFFPSSFHGGYGHGSDRLDGKHFYMKMFFLFLGILAIGHLIF